MLITRGRDSGQLREIRGDQLAGSDEETVTNGNSGSLEKKDEGMMMMLTEKLMVKELDEALP